jgi:small neutral amino acid transporter SnatA (MarC family)
MKLLPENLEYRSWLLAALGMWAVLMLLFQLATGITQFGMGETGLYLAERVYGVLSALLSLHVSARFNSAKQV